MSTHACDPGQLAGCQCLAASAHVVAGGPCKLMQSRWTALSWRLVPHCIQDVNIGATCLSVHLLDGVFSPLWIVLGFCVPLRGFSCPELEVWQVLQHSTRSSTGRGGSQPGLVAAVCCMHMLGRHVSAGQPLSQPKCMRSCSRYWPRLGFDTSTLTMSTKPSISVSDDRAS